MIWKETNLKSSQWELSYYIVKHFGIDDANQASHTATQPSIE
jgi:hypothetical protein